MIKILQGDCRETLKTIPDKSVQMCCTSPPYWQLRSYLKKDHPDKSKEIGQEATPELYVQSLVNVFREIRRALKDDGTLWLNLGDSYASQGGNHGDRADNQRGVGAKQAHLNGSGDAGNRRAPSGIKPKDLIGIPWMVAFALRADGWYLRSDIIWAKQNCMPESVTDRPTRSHEYIFLLSKSPRYYYNHEAIKEPCKFGTGHGRHHLGEAIPESQRRTDKQRGHSRRHDGFNDRWGKMEREEQCTGMRNKRDVWTIAPAQFKFAHFATFPKKLVLPCLLAGSKAGDTVIDPFGGSGTVGELCVERARTAIICELNPEYIPLIQNRVDVQPGLFG